MQPAPFEKTRASHGKSAEWTSVGQAVQRHSLFWLVAANSVGVLLAAELLWPQLGDLLAPFTYGRWVPLHLDWQLYGWCSLPLVGVLLHWIGGGPDKRSARVSILALWGWSLALLAGGVSWLAGVTSGKLFLDWYGWARPLLPAAMTLLWGALVWQLWSNRAALTAKKLAAQTVLLLALFTVPPIIFWASRRAVYPAVNPQSGGATGTSLLGSTLGIVGIFGLLPEMFELVPRVKNVTARKRFFWILLLLSGVVFATLDHTNASSRYTGQKIGLGVLILWIPAAWFYFRGFEWIPPSRPWLAAAFVWWLLLVCTGFLTFLPAVSERLKFTNALVSHAHLAMAGLITSLNIAIINLLNPEQPLLRGFWSWQLATALHVLALAVLGWMEADRPGDLFLSAGWTQELYGVRLASGLIMCIVSVTWFLNRSRSINHVA
jgi:cytochrome c oxidase cbb3-type subunit 1